MTIYTDYDEWKMENIDLINNLLKLNSSMISRFTHVIAICDYLYNESLNKKETEEYLDVIFETAFDYVQDHIYTISSILKKEYRNNLKGMNEHAKSINLLLYTHDFERELDNLDSATEADKNKLGDFEERVKGYIERHEEIPDELFRILDDITYEIFGEEYQDTNSILYEIALKLNLVDTPKEQAIDMVFGFNKNEI